MLRRVSWYWEGHQPAAEADTLAQFSQATDLLSRASLFNQSVLTDGSRISDLEAEGSICNPRVAQVLVGGLRSL